MEVNEKDIRDETDEKRTELVRIVRGLAADLELAADRIDDGGYLGAATEVRSRAFEIERLEAQLNILERYKGDEG